MQHTSIQDLTQHYLHLSLYLLGASKNVDDFMKGTLIGVAFNGYRVFESLIKKSEHRYGSFTEELLHATKGVDKHNSYYERIFAYMDQILAIEAYTLFLTNKTSTWIVRNRENIDVFFLETRRS